MLKIKDQDYIKMCLESVSTELTMVQWRHLVKTAIILLGSIQVQEPVNQLTAYQVLKTDSAE
jgi:hypothetical protein